MPADVRISPSTAATRSWPATLAARGSSSRWSETLGAVGAMFHAGYNGTPLLLAILAFIGAFAMALGPIPWILCSEIFPTKLRGRAMSVATFAIWTSCYIVAQTFPILNDSPAIGPARTFWVYGACSLAGLIFVAFAVPETKGRTLEEIERSWAA